MKSGIALAVALGLGLALSGCGPTGVASGPRAAVTAAMNEGVSLMGQYRYDEAVTAFETAIKAEPQLAAAKVNLAIARFNRARKEDNDISRAGELLSEVLKADPANVRAWYFQGIVLQHIGKTEEAVASFQKVVEQRPADGVAWYLMGMCKQRLGASCEREMLKAIELRPYLGSAYYKLWQTLQSEGQTEKSQPYLEKFKRLRDSPLNETIELQKYNQMGELASVLPLPAEHTPPVTAGAYTVKFPKSAFVTPAPLLHGQAFAFSGAAIAPLGRDGSHHLALTEQSPEDTGPLVWLEIRPDGSFVDKTPGSGLEQIKGARACAIGDLDNDGSLDLFVTGAEGNHLLYGKPDGTFRDGTSQAGVGGFAANPRSVLLLDADHDGDLDALVSNLAPFGIQLWNNNADGTFTNISASAGISCTNANCVMALAGDLDGDRDLDLIVLCQGQPAKVFINDLLGKFHEIDAANAEIRGDLGGVLQDFNGDGHLDVLALGGEPAQLQLHLGDGHGHFQRTSDLTRMVEDRKEHGSLRGFRIADLDLDGDLDIVLFAKDTLFLFNDGAGRFERRPATPKTERPDGMDLGEIAGAEVADFTGDSVPDLLCIQRGGKNRVQLFPGTVKPRPTALRLALTGVRERDGRTRSPATPYGLVMTIRAGLQEQSQVFSGQAGGFNQSPVPTAFGLNGASRADYLQLRWPDGVAQVEATLAAGREHRISELERKISSCPVLFAWNGKRFEFITDFAGVGGLGYFIAPGEYAQPQALEHIKIEPEQLQARNGFYELRIAEPMEETAYIDQIELLAVDHPAGWCVTPDERLAVTGAQPSHELLVVSRPILPQRASDPLGRDCTKALAKLDRIYAYQPALDRRFFGFCRPHSLELDFGNALANVTATNRLFLFISGYLEYPYSQTAYAASQARVGWEPIRIERRQPDGSWEVIVADAGAFGGMARTMTVDLTGRLGGTNCHLRLTSNLEIYYDRVFLAQDLGQDRVHTRKVPLSGAELRRLGFPREVSPDARMPLVYDYEQRDATAPFHVLRGAYTRHGPVDELLDAFDDRYVLVGPGDEIALKFQSSALPRLERDMVRSFILVSHAYCKDMDLYTATPQTLEPLPFRGMSRYPYPPSESYPQTEAIIRYQEAYNTKVVK